MSVGVTGNALGFDPAHLDAFLRAAIPGLRGPMQLERVSGGQSNPTFFLTLGDRRLVLRKKPAGQTLPSAHAVDREARVIAALAGSGVPVPAVVLFHPDPDVIGTPFYVMERVEGRVFPTADLPGAADRGAMYASYAEAMARLHDVDWRAAGLEGFGKPGGYFARQIDRWTRQWEAARFRDVPELGQLAAWLHANLPGDDGAASVCHGDFRLGNVMFHPAEPRVVAVLDWELSTIGHPLADLAFGALAWRTLPAEYGGLRGLDLPALGIPSEAEWVAGYWSGRRQAPHAELTPFHVAFALFRFAVIFEGIAARARAGTAAAENAAEVGELSLAFARRGVEAISNA